MGFHVQKHTKEDFYPIYCKWTERHQGIEIMSPLLLPEFCFVAYNDDVPIYAMWFWFTNSKIAIVAFLMSNKSVNYKKRIGGKNILIKEIIKYAKRKGQLLIYSPTTSKDVINVLIEEGFSQGDTDSSQYFLQIK